jgi:hypothetical protein
MSAGAAVAQQVRDLKAMNIDALRLDWRRRFREPPPALRAADLLRRCLADRIQTEAFGVDPELDRKLAALARAHGRGEAPRSARPIFRPGTVLVREHDGRSHRVEVMEAGFAYDDKVWKSLSQIARAITGVRWNGPRFFGLRDLDAKGDRP